MKLGNRSLHRRTVAGAVALLSIAALGATACSSDDSTGSGAAEASTTSLPSDPAEGAPVKIGLVSTEGGAVVSLPAVRQGAEAAVKYVNANGGGLAGRPIELVVCKQQEDPTSATKCANELVEQKVAAVLSGGTSQGPAIVPIVTGAGIPFVTLNGVSAVELTSPDVAALSAGLPGTVSAIAAAAKEQGSKKVTIFASDGGGMGSIIGAMGDPIFKAAGIELNVVPIALGVPDPTPLVTAGLSEKPEAVSIVADAATCSSVLKAIQTTDPSVKKILIPVCLEPDVVKVVGIDALKGNTGITATDYLSDRPDSVLYRSIMTQYAPDLSVTGSGATGYQTVMAVVAATKGITGDVTASTIKDALATASNVEMPAGGGITFSCNGTAFPQMPSLCSNKMLLGEINDEGIPVNVTVAG